MTAGRAGLLKKVRLPNDTGGQMRALYIGGRLADFLPALRSDPSCKLLR